MSFIPPWKWTVVFLIAVLISGCSSTAAQPGPSDPENRPFVQGSQATITSVPANEPIRLPSPTALLQATTLSPTPTPFPCEVDWCVVPGRFFFDRPIGPNGNQQIERYYSYGSSQGGTRDPHHGVEFTNPQGTPVLAVADGEVAVAGTDHSTEYGWGLDYYGNLVVIKHDLPGIALPIYTLYGHLSRVNVEVGDKVSSGDVLGEVGSTGTAQGAHLHFEVRQGGNTYWDTRNPELWLKPCSNCGILLGTILDAQNQVKRFPDIKLEKLDHETPGKPVYLDSYDDPALKGDDVFQEIFAIGDLPAGEYQITFSPYGAAQRIRVQVLPGQITKITLHTH